MAVETKLHLLGLHTAPNIIDPRAQAGTFEIADNVVIDQPNLLEPRKGFERLRAYTGKAVRMYVHDPDGKQQLVIVLDNGQLWRYEEASSTWVRIQGVDELYSGDLDTAYSAEVVLGLPETLTPTYVNNVTLLNDSKLGVVGQYTQEGGVLIPHPNPIAWRLSASPGAESRSIPIGKEIAFKLVLVHNLPDGSQIRSAPSPTYWARRPSSSPIHRINFGTMYAKLYHGPDTPVTRTTYESQELEVYLTDRYSIGSPPPTEFYKAINSIPYPYQHFVGATFVDYEKGAALYTNPSQQGIESIPRRGLTASVIEGYGGTLFMGAVKDASQVVYRFNQRQNPRGVYNNPSTRSLQDGERGIVAIKAKLKRLGSTDVDLFTWATEDGLENVESATDNPAWYVRTGVAELSLTDRWHTAAMLILELNEKLPKYGLEVVDLNGYSEDSVGTFAVRQVPSATEQGWELDLDYQFQTSEDSLPLEQRTWLQQDVAVLSKVGGKATLNEVAFSRPDEPNTVPISNTFRVGDGEILGMKALREALLVFCSDGIYRVTGTNPNYFVEKIDNSAVLLAPKSLAVLDNQVLAYTTQGVVAVDSVGVKILSSNIAETFQANYTVHTNNAKAAAGVGEDVGRTRIFKEAYGTTDDVLRRYYLSIPNTFSGGSVMYVYSATTTAWTRWTISAEDGINDGSKFTYLDPTYPLVYRQKKFYTDFDYSDQQQGFTTQNHGYGKLDDGTTVSDLRVPAGIFAQYAEGDGVEALGQTFIVRKKVDLGEGNTARWSFLLDRWEPSFNAGGGDACVFHKAITTKIKYNPIMEANPGPMKQWIRGLFFFKTPLVGTGTVTLSTDVLKKERSHEISSYRELHTGGLATTETIRMRGIRGGRLSLQLEIRQAFTPYELEGVSLTARSSTNGRYRRR